MNNRDLKTLNDTIIDRLSNNDFIVFTGTGIVEQTGIPNWKNLLRKLLNNTSNLNIDIDNVSPSEYPNIAQAIYDELVKENKGDEYHKIIKGNVKPTDAPYTVQQLEIISTSKYIVTTNFDNTFETAFEKVNITPRVISLPDFPNYRPIMKPTLVYLHGNIYEEFIVFKTNDYEENYPSVSGNANSAPELEEYLKDIYKNQIIVFIGFSFDDKYLLESLKNIYHEIESSDIIFSKKPKYKPRLPDIEHYVLLKEVSFKNGKHILDNLSSLNPESMEYRMAMELMSQINLDEALDRINIKVIRYTEHIEWIYLLKKIRNLRERPKAANAE